MCLVTHALQDVETGSQICTTTAKRPFEPNYCNAKSCLGNHSYEPDVGCSTSKELSRRLGAVLFAKLIGTYKPDLGRIKSAF